MALRIAMWSGPRNISTAMMRAWENRDDTFVIDEPLYAHYLLETKLPHPGADEVIAHHETDPRKIVDYLTGPIPRGRSIFYQKHMAHQLLPGMDRSWLASVTNCFLIRDPREMLISLAKFTPSPRIEDTGLPQQMEIFQQTCSNTRAIPIILDARDILQNPEIMTRRMCEALDVPFQSRMLHWPAGPRDTDGVWGKHWYDAVWKSTCFEPYRTKSEPLPTHLEKLCQTCESFYQVLHARRIHE